MKVYSFLSVLPYTKIEGFDSMDLQAIYALFLSIIAGMATLVGAIIVIFTQTENKKFISASLGFASGIMISVSMLELFSSANDLITSGINSYLGPVIATLSLAMGMLLTFIINHFVQDDNESLDNINFSPKNKLFSVGIVSMLAIALHNFPEGMATFLTTTQDLTLGMSVAFAIAIHNIPEGIAVALPVYHATGKKRYAMLYAAMSGITEPIGALVGMLIFGLFVPHIMVGVLMAAVAGIMTYISFDTLLPLAKEYGNWHLSIIGIISGILFIWLSLILIG